MFDVSWTDPTRETVGQRKSRKEQKENGISRDSSVRSSQSNESMQLPQIRPSLLNVFASDGIKSKSIKRAGSHSRLSTLPTEDTSKSSRRVSSYTVASDSSGRDFTPATQIPANNFFTGGSYHSDADQSNISEVPESIFSGWTGKSHATESTWSSILESPIHQGKLVQSLDGSSFVTQSTEITVSPRDSVRADEQIATVVSISAAPTMPIEIRDIHRKSITLPPSPSSGNADNQQQGWPIATRSRQSDTWRPPAAWECPREEQELVSISPPNMLGPPLVPIKDSRRKPPPPELSHLQRSIRRMESASPKIILERLKEEWLEVADASVYRELELEKQLWMLTALQGLKKKKSKGIIEQLKVVSLETNAIKMLSLYENHASSSFLSALNPQHTIHHISTFPLSPSQYPNIHPLCVPSPTGSLPYASKLFTHIHAFSIPALLPASSIPILLKECHRTLTSAPNTNVLVPPSPSSPTSFDSASTNTIVPPKAKVPTSPGTLHLTILDPAPLPDTLGPLLRTWLDDHLILNLERQFRCINPGRLFPIWLADAGLRAEGSTIVNVRFRACINSEEAREENDEETNIKKEMKTAVGRMLWKEIWGAFVEGDKWWWEDEMIVQECLKKGTTWEYAVIEGVKDG